MKQYIKNTQFLEYLNSHDDSKISNYDFLYDFVINKVGISLNRRSFNMSKRFADENFGGAYSKQNPHEITKLLLFIYQNRHNINSYLEVGTNYGGTFFMIDSFLRRINKKYSGSLGIDKKIKDISRFNLNEYCKIFQDCVFKNVESDKFVLNSCFDMIFIDASHRYEHAKADYEKYLKHCNNFMVFHDIVYSVPEIVEIKKLWDNISKIHKNYELVDYGSVFPPLGIGILEINKNEKI